MSTYITARHKSNPRPSLVRRGFAGLGDRAFYCVCLTFSLTVVAVILWIGYSLYTQSLPAQHRFGWSLLKNLVWDVPNEQYGVLPVVLGTVYSSLIALLIAVPISIGSALFLTEIAPRWIAVPLSFMIEMLAAIPSVIFGLWGFFVLCPLLNGEHSPGQFLADRFGSIPLFEGPPLNTNLLSAGVVLAIMILPFITSVSREVIRTVPAAQREASLGLGATRWETISKVVLKASRSGIVGAVILGLGRAIGETMAVVMVIGNSLELPKSLLQPASTMPGLLANQFGEAQNEPMQRAVLLEVALLLFVITLLVNGLARLLILMTSRHGTGTTNPIQERALGIGAAMVRWAAGLAIALVLGRQVLLDVTTHGPKGLLGPVELALIGFAGVRAVTELARRSRCWVAWRKMVHRAMVALVTLSASAGSIALGFLLYYVVVNGFRALSPQFFSQSTNDTPGGMLNGIVGTLVLVAIAGCIGIPIGLMCGIYLAEYRGSRLVPYVRFAADVLNGVPSVVMGMFGYALFVLPFGHFSAWAGGATLGIMMIPTVARTSEEMLRLVPSSLREASLGLGATRLRTILTVVVPAASSGIITGVMLAIARIAGETAPLLFTALGNNQMTLKPSDQMSSMTLEIYKNYTQGDLEQSRTWAGALVLMGIVLCISLLARIATRKKYALR
jgi:phosphate transport system permease protein